MAMFAILLLLTALWTGEVTSYTACKNATQHFQGYTYTIDPVTSEKVWSHCKFHNPRFDALLCGIEGSTDQHYICDPDKLITSQVLAVDRALKAIQTQTSTQCTAPNGEVQSFIVAMALINRIRIPDFNDPDICINDCGQIQPVLNSSPGEITSAQKNIIMENFATYLRTEWGMGACGNDVILLYCQEFDLLYVSVGYGAGNLVTSAVIADIVSTFGSYKAGGNIAEGLFVISEKLRVTLRSVTPAHILLILNMIGLTLLGIFLFFFLYLRDLEYNVWGREGVWCVLGEMVYWLSGAWIFHGLLYFVIYTSLKAPYAGILAALLAGVVMVALFVYENTLFKNPSILSTSNSTI
ncbi:uncharacterized protein LOC110465870 [Mizuhopecten yessoensis]|uniref:Uncharacterized protein n=1 Tax=Mizuhopecten yessoensis TaxID=6573 RepID=A0A210PQR1_MIZYE|nr:uncharacterized protein LOC110465870 [Mizuhopecten yessoensis]XP_021377671.1 uncharacterized protein LOC110465870 [Mizuhopecten yessoensis]XP_021377672.1 uncharacterized protein LOC110465870 [Mizuhopecten yessoensis]OWF38792.1 hypothetical protein KP79_PYT16676 [Mizuhopecten yessoensis]